MQTRGNSCVCALSSPPDEAPFRQINVTDVNDNPPFLADPREVRVTENSGPQLVAQVKLGDLDDWHQGHGPPFTISLDPRAPPHITDCVRVTLDTSEFPNFLPYWLLLLTVIKTRTQCVK